jgi:hypothetical protein
MPANTASLSAIWGTHFGFTKLPASITLCPRRGGGFFMERSGVATKMRHTPRPRSTTAQLGDGIGVAPLVAGVPFCPSGDRTADVRGFAGIGLGLETL